MMHGTRLRIVFAGSPSAAVPSLELLLTGPHEVCAVITREDARLGRKRILTPTPVAEAAQAAGIPVLKANRLSQVEAEVLGLGADLGVIVAYGGLVREPLLSAPRLGWVNLHFSLLPRWRGAAPVQWAIIAGDQETGAAVFQLVPDLDAGPVYATHRTSIGRNETAGHLLDRLAQDGADLLAGVVADLAAGTAVATEQRGEPTSAPKLELEDARIDWTADVRTIDARIRGVSPEPGAFSALDGVTIKVLDAAIAHDEPPLPPGTVAVRGGRVLIGTATDPLELVTIHPAGRRAMAAIDWWRGRGEGAPVVLG